MHAHGHAAGVAIADLDMAIDHHGAAHEAHGAHADAVAEFLEVHLDGGDAGVGIAVADHAQAGRLLAEHHADVLGAAEPDADNGRLAGEPALAELDQGVEVEPPDAFDAVGREQHAVIAAEQPALVHRGQLDPVGVGVKGVFDLRGADAAIVVVVGAPQRVDAVGAQRHVVGGIGGGAAQRRFERDRAAFDAGLVADLDIPARHAGVAAHGAAVLLRRLVILQHRLDDEGGEIALLGVGGAAQPVEIIVGYLDRGLRHQGLGRALHRCDRDHRNPPIRPRCRPAASRRAARG